MSAPQAIAELLAETGLATLTVDTPLPEVEERLRALRARLNGADPIRRATIRSMLLEFFKRAKVAGAADLVTAALAPAAESAAAELAPASVGVPPAPDVLLAAGRAVLDAPNILQLIATYVVAQGYAGDTRAPNLVYLALTSRVFPRPVNLFLSGPSAGGKNFTVRVVCPLFPPEAYYAVAGMSPLAPMYSAESFEHRTVIVSEASAFHDDGIGASLLRGLAWEGELKYDTVIDGEAVHLHKPGPTGLITTGTRKLEPELATRLWTVPVPDDAKHTRAVLRVTAEEATGHRGSAGEAEPFIAAQRWLAVAGERGVVVPYAGELATLMPAHEVRMRRDFTQLLTLVKTHAFLHQRRRERDPAGRIIAALDDYAAVYDVVQPVFRASLSGGLTPEVRETVSAVAALTSGGVLTATVSAVAARLELSVTATWRRCRLALDGHWLVNDEPRKRQAAKLRVGEPMPDVPGLPAPPEVAQTRKRTSESVVVSKDPRLRERLRGAGSETQSLNPDTAARDAMREGA